MAALSKRKLWVVRTLVETAPDGVVVGLREALAGDGGEAVASVRALVAQEACDRSLRNVVLSPIVPMCVGGGDPLRLTFPAHVAGLIWRSLKAQAPHLVRNAQRVLDGDAPGDPVAEPFDRLLRLAAASLRAAEGREFRAVRDACDAAWPGRSEALLACLEIAPVVRSVTPKLPEWITHQTPETMAGARLAYKDAVALCADGGPAFFQMLAAQLPNPSTILRIISAVMERPTERYLAGSELGVFGEIVLREMEEALGEAGAFDVDGDAWAARTAARRVNFAVQAAAELETYVSLCRDHGWGRTLLARRNALAEMVEARCDEAERLFAYALPGARSGRGRCGHVRPAAAPDEAAVRRCRNLLTFIGELRGGVSHGGFAAVRSRLLETLGADLDRAVEDLLDVVKAGDGQDAAGALALLAVAADLSALARDERTAELVRRRAAAAAAPPPLDPG